MTKHLQTTYEWSGGYYPIDTSALHVTYMPHNKWGLSIDFCGQTTGHGDEEIILTHESKDFIIAVIEEILTQNAKKDNVPIVRLAYCVMVVEEAMKADD